MRLSQKLETGTIEYVTECIAKRIEKQFRLKYRDEQRNYWGAASMIPYRLRNVIREELEEAVDGERSGE